MKWASPVDLHFFQKGITHVCIDRPNDKCLSFGINSRSDRSLSQPFHAPIWAIKITPCTNTHTHTPAYARTHTRKHTHLHTHMETHTHTNSTIIHIHAHPHPRAPKHTRKHNKHTNTSTHTHGQTHTFESQRVGEAPSASLWCSSALPPFVCIAPDVMSRLRRSLILWFRTRKACMCILYVCVCVCAWACVCVHVC